MKKSALKIATISLKIETIHPNSHRTYITLAITSVLNICYVLIETPTPKEKASSAASKRE